MESIRLIEQEMASATFWNEQEKAQKRIAEMKLLKSIVEPYQGILKTLQEAEELLAMTGDGDEQFLKDIESSVNDCESRFALLEHQTLFNGPNDAKDVFFSVHAGAGGTDSCDWADILLRMYMRWFSQNDYTVSMVDRLDGEEAGVKRVLLAVSGKFPFGNLKSEIGVHRLVRISPFDANKKRHTSFASVDVVPQYDDINIEIDEKEIRIDTYRAGGAGGQHVNKTDSAVRITHIPTGVVAQCQNERSQHMNRKMAMSILKAKLHQMKEQERQAELAKMYGAKGEIAWSNQIRSYVIHPYTLVKDHRTDLEIGNIHAILDGAIDPFIDAFLRWKERKY